MTERVCYIHAGTGKTGSSAIQYALTKAADDLPKYGYKYPNIDGNFHEVLDCKPTAGNARLVQKRMRLGEVDLSLKWVRPHAEGQEHLILSNEGFARAPVKHLVKFCDGLREFGFSTRCLVFFRPQYDLIVSSYLQHIKSNKVMPSETLREYALRFASRDAYNWFDRAGYLKKTFDDVTVKWYPAVVRRGPNGVVDATFEWLGVPSLASASGARIINPTPGLEAVHVLQRINSEGLGNKLVADEFLMRAQAEGVLGSKVELDRETLETIHSAMYDSNVALLERYCPDLSPAEELKMPQVAAEQPSPDPEAVKRLDAIATQVMALMKDGVLDPRLQQKKRRELRLQMRTGSKASVVASKKKTLRWWLGADRQAPAGD